ncbi:MAG: T9SS type A sorting domain-containing protein [Muribaculaceae bacterium]|nr:T9SS type A sorting domain-containing protein [Muribaculaceae bacterium]
MIKILHVIAMSLVAISVAGAVPKSMVVHTTYGEKAYSIGNIRKIAFDKTADGSMKIYPKDGSSALTYSYAYFVKGTFSDQSGIDELNLTEDIVDVVYNSAMQTVRIASSESVSSVQIYDLRGSLALVENPAGDIVEVPVASLQSGLYIVKVSTTTGVVTRKIVKR